MFIFSIRAPVKRNRIIRNALCFVTLFFHLYGAVVSLTSLFYMREQKLLQIVIFDR
jgi:hypothetical protein